MNVLVACEFSGRVRDAFIARGHNAISCDFRETERPGPHYRGDVRDILGNGFDLMIGHPDCTHTAVSGAKFFEQKRRDGRQHEAIEFFKLLWNAGIDKICLEHPVSIISTVVGPPDQIIQPYYFGDPFTKTTCLWLKNLPKLVHIRVPDLFNENPTHTGKGEFKTWSSGRRHAAWISDARKRSKDTTQRLRSRTFPGIAEAMAGQWG